MSGPAYQPNGYGYPPAQGYGQQHYPGPHTGAYDPHYAVNTSYDSPSYKRPRQDSNGWSATPPPYPQPSCPQAPAQQHPGFVPQYPPAYPPYTAPTPTPPAQQYPPPAPPSQWQQAPAPYNYTQGQGPHSAGYAGPQPQPFQPAGNGHPPQYGQYPGAYMSQPQYPPAVSLAPQPYHQPASSMHLGQGHARSHSGPGANDRPMPSSIQYRPGQQSSGSAKANPPVALASGQRATSFTRKRTASQSIEPTNAILAMQDEEIYLPQYHDGDFKADPNGHPEVQPDKADEHFFANKEEDPNLSLGTITSKPPQFLRAVLPADFEAATSKMQHQWQLPPKIGDDMVIVSSYTTEDTPSSQDFHDPRDPVIRDLTTESKLSQSISHLKAELEARRGEDAAIAKAMFGRSSDFEESDFEPCDFRKGEYPKASHPPGSRYEFVYHPVPQEPVKETVSYKPPRNGNITNGMQTSTSDKHNQNHTLSLSTSYQPTRPAVSGSSSKPVDVRVKLDGAANNFSPAGSLQFNGSNLANDNLVNGGRNGEPSRPSSSHSNRPPSSHALTSGAVSNHGSQRSGHRRQGSVEQPAPPKSKRSGHRRNSSVEEPKVFQKDLQQESILASLGVTGSATNVFGVPGPARSRSVSPVRGTTPQPSASAPILTKRPINIPPPPAYPPPPLEQPADPMKWDADTIRPSSRSSVHTAYGDPDEDELPAPTAQATALTPIKESPEEPTSTKMRKRKHSDDENKKPEKQRQRPDHTTPFKRKGPTVDPAYRRRWD